MRALLIDNHDSFSYNLFQLLWEVNGVEPLVVRNDETSWGELAGGDFDAVVISPGPGRPERERDFGLCAEAIRRCELPLLGVCLGHQGIGWVHGGAVTVAPEPLHGRVAAVEQCGDSPLFAGLPRRFGAVRYHSLCLARPLPDCLEEIARGEDGVTMAVAHRDRPQWGVQFHPESVAAEHGARILANFRNLAADAPPPSELHQVSVPRELKVDAVRGVRVVSRRLDVEPDAERVFAALYADSEVAFWLDSARRGRRGRFSCMGDASGPLAATIAYDVEAGTVRIERGGTTEVVPGPLLDHVERERLRLCPDEPPDLPFGFDCGFVGYLGYELKAELGGDAVHRSEHPDAALVLADRLLAFDHERGHTYLLCLVEPGGEAEAEAWLDATARRLEALVAQPPLDPPAAVAASEPPEVKLARRRDRYMEDVAVCKAELREGESYEVCLTNTAEVETEAAPFDLYRRLRRVNPAPFGAYLRFGAMAVLSSSPERFLAVDRAGAAEARPIKGTSGRATDPEADARLATALATDQKNRSENLMIADLLRNDLGVVCEPGSVEVPELMAVESFATVHQLVTTVWGRLRAGFAATDAVRACFPPGSMTGAPKRRTTEILDALEGEARGVYSGAIGYLGLGGGCDLAVAIRTIVLAGGRARVGAGGAVVLQSDPAAEYEEMLLKAAAPLRAIDPRLDPVYISLADRPAALASPAPVPDPS